MSNFSFVSFMPQVRVTIEALIVKIAAYFFGPIIGMVVAFITDSLVLLFVPAYVH
jgi:hypothetical protein